MSTESLKGQKETKIRPGRVVVFDVPEDQL